MTIRPYNAGKKKTEAAGLLAKWFPQMESFQSELNKYKSTIRQMSKENQQLERQLEQSELVNQDRLTENIILEKQISRLERFVGSIPEDITQQLEHKRLQTRHNKKRR